MERTREAVKRETPDSAEEVARLVGGSARLRVTGGASKWTPGEGSCTLLSTEGLRGVINYEPGEYTVTVHAGTLISELDRLLAAEGQYLPFDPLRVEAGATVGGTIAAGAHGPGRIRFGGVRDFLLGVRVVDGSAALITGGGRVVKNAAGFDLPKLMVGSRGRLGVLVEATFKVFPRSPEIVSVRVRAGEERDLFAVHEWLVVHASDFAGLELAIDHEASATALWLRLAGLEGAALERARHWSERLRAAPCWAAGCEVDIVSGAPEVAFWRSAVELERLGGTAPAAWLRFTTRPSSVEHLETRLRELRLDRACRRWSAGARTLWLGVDDALADALADGLADEQASGLVLLDRALAEDGVAGEVFLGELPRGGLERRLGLARVDPFAERVRRALDPEGRFAEPAGP